MFLVAGGEGSSTIDSTETLIEGGQAWNLINHDHLPTDRKGLRGISLLDTVILTGKKITFTFY